MFQVGAEPGHFARTAGAIFAQLVERGTPALEFGFHGRQLLAEDLRLCSQRLRLGQRLGAPGCQLLLALGQFGALFNALLAFRTGLGPLLVN